MKNSIKNSLRISALTVVSMLAFASCNDWTEPESLDVKTPQVDPGVYADYLKNLKAYKAGEHKVVFLAYENTTEYPANQSQHLTVLPDSVDFISLDNPDNLNPVIADEMSKVREKGTRVVYNVDFTTFESEWIQILKEDETGKLTEEDALAYFTRRTEEMLALCDKWGYDGVTVTYTGRSLVSLTEAEKAVYRARQASFLEPILEWRAEHTKKSFSFIGNPQFLLDENRTMLVEYDYIILPTDAAVNVNDLTVNALAAISAEGMRADCIVVSTQTTRPDDEKQIYGYFGTTDENGNKVRSIFGSATWVVMPETSFTRSGLMIRHAQYDYFDNTLVYRSIREAIGIMNPSPKN